MVKVLSESGISKARYTRIPVHGRGILLDNFGKLQDQSANLKACKDARSQQDESCSLDELSGPLCTKRCDITQTITSLSLHTSRPYTTGASKRLTAHAPIFTDYWQWAPILHQIRKARARNISLKTMLVALREIFANNRPIVGFSFFKSAGQ